MRFIALLTILALLPIAGFGCANGPGTPGGPLEVTFTPPDDVPVPGGFTLKQRDPVPTSSEVARVRTLRAGWWTSDSPGMNAVSVHFTAILQEHGWEFLGYDRVPVDSRKWQGRWRKGDRQTLTVTYTEKIEDVDGHRRTTGDLLIVIGGGR